MARRKRTYKPYALFIGILYGRFKWLTRLEDGTCILPSTSAGSHFKYEPKELREAGEHLYALGLLDRWEWRGTWALAKPSVPSGMERNIRIAEGHTLDITEDSSIL